jgi:hypothetical protein
MDGMSERDRRIPRGIGKGGIAPASLITDILHRGAAAVLAHGYGWEGDLERCEEGGISKGAAPSVVSDKAVTGSRATGPRLSSSKVTQVPIESEGEGEAGLWPHQGIKSVVSS